MRERALKRTLLQGFGRQTIALLVDLCLKGKSGHATTSLEPERSSDQVLAVLVGGGGRAGGGFAAHVELTIGCLCAAGSSFGETGDCTVGDCFWKAECCSRARVGVKVFRCV